MSKFKSVILFFSVFIFTSLIISCENTSTRSEKNEVDSISVQESVKKAALNKILIQEKPDFILDSLNLEYTIDGEKIINKRVLVELHMIKDIYEDKERVKHIIIEGEYGNYIDLTCTPEQINIIRGANYESGIYLFINPVSVRKIDFQYVSKVDDGFFEEGEKPTSKIEVEDLINRFIIKGKLINIRTKENE